MNSSGIVYIVHLHQYQYKLWNNRQIWSSSITSWTIDSYCNTMTWASFIHQKCMKVIYNKTFICIGKCICFMLHAVKSWSYFGKLSSGFRGQGCIEIMNMQTATMNGIQVFYTFLNFSITHILKTGLFQVHVYLMNISCNLSTVIQMNTL